MRPEGWLRLPNVLFGAATAAILFLFCRQMMGLAGSFAAAFFWAVSPLAVAINRLDKEETPVTFFTLLACYFYCRAKQASTARSTGRWYDLSGSHLWIGHCLTISFSSVWAERAGMAPGGSKRARP